MPENASMSPLGPDDSARADECDRLRDVLTLAMQRIVELETIGRTFHDFNNILSSSMGYSSLASERAASLSDEKLSRYLNNIEKAGIRSRDLVRECLAKRQSYRESQRSELGSVISDYRERYPAREINTQALEDLTINLNEDSAAVLFTALADAVEGERLTLSALSREEPQCAGCGSEIRGSQLQLTLNGDAGLVFSDPAFALVEAIAAANGGHICKSLVQADQIVVYLKACAPEAD